jgi:ribosomal protein S12 methylthiotransferase
MFENFTARQNIFGYNAFMKVGIISLGCPKNLTDTEAVMGLLAAAGHDISADPELADLVIINTCAFVGDAIKESMAAIKKASRLKKTQKTRVIVMGCLPKRMEHSLFDKFPEVDAIVGPGDLHKMLEVIGRIGREKQAYLSDGSCLFGHEFPKIKATLKHYAYIKIADGCNNHCSYCIVPKLRGKYRSRPMESIILEVKALVKTGLKEAILIAQDTTMYGSDIYGKPSLHTLCKKLARIKGLAWIRIMYAHPAHVTDELIKTIKNEPKICKYLDLPIQHACDNILTSMRRKITASGIRELISKLRRRIPGLAIRTSVIVGYPGESNEYFESLYRFIEESRFTRLGVFKYSRESGTPAAEMRGQISKRVKEIRFHKLMSLQRRISGKILKSMVGKVLKVLSEGSIGRSYMDAPDIDGFVMLDKNVPHGKIVAAKVTGSRPYDLSAKLIT